MIEAAIFDMDGLLIDSEPLWRRAEIEVFESVGVTLTDAMCRETTGLRIDEVARYWYARAPFDGASPSRVAERIVDRMIELVRARGSACAGAHQAVQGAYRRGWPVALASSSPERLIQATLDHLDLSFDVVASAEHERYGKPHPAVFLRAAGMLGVEPTRCLVLEDSLNGVIAAKAARMVCVAVPDPDARSDPRFSLADRVLGSLGELDDALGELAPERV